jgi:hypothetical protein
MYFSLDFNEIYGPYYTSKSESLSGQKLYCFPCTNLKQLTKL